MATHAQGPAIHGLLAEFDRPDLLVEAARKAKEHGFTRLDGYSPMPIHELIEVLKPVNRVAPAVLAGGLIGAAVGFGLQYWVSVLEYPVNIGGRPWFSWPAFIVPMFETTILFAALTAVFGMLIMNGLPQPYHPLFHSDRFAEASRSRFFLLIEAEDPKFDLQATKAFLAGMKPLSVEEIPH